MRNAESLEIGNEQGCFVKSKAGGELKPVSCLGMAPGTQFRIDIRQKSGRDLENVRWRQLNFSRVVM